jgi:hypothetical protein
LMSRGVPAEWIETTTSREGVSGSSRNASPEAKAAARGATLEIGTTLHRRDVVDRFGDVTYYKLEPSWWPPKLPDWRPPKLPDFPKPPRPNWRKLGRRALENVAEHVADGMGIVVVGGLIRRRFVRLLLKKILEIAMRKYGRKLGADAYEYIAKKVVEDIHQHHVLVQKLVERFAAAGINAHEYTQFMPESVHQWLHKTGWNQVWETYFEVFEELTGDQPQAEEIIEFLAQMMEHWGIQDLPLEPYLRKSIPR